MNEAPNGILLVDKAEGWTSHDVVAKARRALGTRKVGHAGTLDPMATGLLVLGAGPATRLLTHLVGLDKTYTATIRLGQSTVTDDREGEVLSTATPEAVRALVVAGAEAGSTDGDGAASNAALREAVAALTGQIEQAPSAVSAIKVDGRRAYDRVRAGEEVQLKKRAVTVHRFDVGPPKLVELAGEDGADPVVVLDLEATVTCSSGTYVRALARDLGEALGVGGHLTGLRRTAVGPFGVDDSVSNEVLASDAPLTGGLATPAEVASRLFPVLQLDEEQTVDLGHGKRVDVSGTAGSGDASSIPNVPLAAALAPDGRLIGLVEVKGGRTRVVTNFPVSSGAAQPSSAEQSSPGTNPPAQRSNQQ